MAAGVKIAYIFQKILIDFAKALIGRDHREKPTAPGEQVVILFVIELLIKCPDQGSGSTLVLGAGLRFPAEKRLCLSPDLSLKLILRDFGNVHLPVFITETQEFPRFAG